VAFPGQERALAIATRQDANLRVLIGVNVYHSRARVGVAVKIEEYDAVQTIDIQDYARQLFEAHGFKAIAEAAQKARAFEEQGDNEQAETWRRIESALMLMRGPNES
jgi:hypothetical protein